jgi:hypothetical protein
MTRKARDTEARTEALNMGLRFFMRFDASAAT